MTMMSPSAVAPRLQAEEGPVETKGILVASNWVLFPQSKTRRRLFAHLMAKRDPARNGSYTEERLTNWIKVGHQA